MSKQQEPGYESAYRAMIDAALAQCASEPIHLIGHIQSVGVLLACDPRDGRVVVASSNLAGLFGVTPASALGRPLVELVGQESWTRILAWGQQNPAAPLVCSLDLGSRAGASGGAHDAQVYTAGPWLVVEIECSPQSRGDVFHELFVPVRDALWKLDGEEDLDRYAQAVVDQVRVLTGFDRVMMYRFDSSWDGEVIAESRVETVGSYLGNHFPASDIPPQARELYVRNLVRLVADVNDPRVALLPCTAQAPDAPLDLSLSWLRSLSPVHVEYLRNMGVSASLSISLVQHGRLWGLIACHHFSPKAVTLREREMAELIGRTVSLKLMNMENRERALLNNRIRDLLYELTDLIRHAQDVSAVVRVVGDKLMGLVRASGCVLAIGTKHLTIGDSPAPAQLDSLVETLRAYPVAPVFHTDRIDAMLGQGAVAENGEGEGDTWHGGFLVAPLDHRMENYVMWFRPGLLRTLRWAGRPDKQVICDEQGLRISPRQSFETWIETHRGKCLPWSQAEIDAANALSLALIEALSEHALKSSEERYRLLAENSTDLIASLDLGGRFRFVSPACRELFGLDAESLLGRPLTAVLDDQDGKITGLLASLHAPGATGAVVARGRRADGGVRWIEASLRHTLGSGGNNEVIMNARDVTQRYNYQLAIEEVHRRNTRILDAAGEGLVSLDADGRVVYANEWAGRLLGRGQLTGGDVCTLLGGQGGAGASNPFLLTLADGETRQGLLEVPSTRPLGAVTLKYVCTPLFENQATVGCVVVFTESPEGRGDGRDGSSEVFLDQAEEAVMVTAPDGCITSVNRAFTEITGFSSEEAVGNWPRILKSGVHTPHFYGEFWRQLKETGRWTGEIWNRRKNGQVYPQWGSVTAIRAGDGVVKNYVAVFSDVSKAKQAEEKLYYLANHDPLTGLPNRMRFSEQLAASVERCRRIGGGLAVAFIDLDNFKVINDTLGHGVGDSYLKTVAERLLVTTRKMDVLARWGGDEFVLAMADVADREAAAGLVARLVEGLGRSLHLEGHELCPTASIGIALFPQDGTVGADLVKAADSAMYLAKKRGRNRFEFYTPSMGESLDMKLRLVSEMRRALGEGEFFLVFQPQVNPATGAIQGVEALIRWHHPSRGLLPPACFLPQADELGLMEELGSWVLVRACEQMRNWYQAGVPIPRVAVNVAPCQLKDSFVARVAGVLRDTGLPPHCLEIEITEGALESGEMARRVSEGLRYLGVLLSVDDFGTGYSSLSHLKLLPITCFKIDKSFVDGIPANPDDVAIVRTILALGESLQVEVVAEGAERAEQVSFLETMGVESVQGFYYSQPRTPEDLLTWLAGRSPDRLLGTQELSGPDRD